MAKHLTIFGGGVAVIGAAVFIYAVSFNSPYPGYSGGGMAGIDGAVTILLAMAMMAMGAAVAVVSIIVSAVASRRSSKKDGIQN